MPKRLAVQIAVEIFHTDCPDGALHIDVSLEAGSCDVRRDQDVFHVPEQRRFFQRLRFQNVQHRAAQKPFSSANTRSSVFTKLPRPTFTSSAPFFHRKQPRARQKALGFRRGRQAVDDDVCLRQKFIRFVHGVSIRKPRGQCFTSCAPDARDLRAERGQPPRNICAEVSHAEDERALSADCTALRVLLPDMRLLLAQ